MTTMKNTVYHMTAVNKLSELELSFHQPLAVVALTQNNHNWFMHQTKSS